MIERFIVIQVVSDSMFAELKECFMEAYDDNRDGKIEIREVCAHRLTYSHINFYSFINRFIWRLNCLRICLKLF